jgi:hypothetical protein
MFDYLIQVMILVTDVNQFNKFNLFFSEPIKNNLLHDGLFIRIISSSDNLTLNGIYLLFNLYETVCEKYFNKYRLSFNIKKNEDIIKTLQQIEEQILNLYKCSKHRQFKISDQLSLSHLKLFNPCNNNQLLLKISGIWETQFSYGITYKFYPSVV